MFGRLWLAALRDNKEADPGFWEEGRGQNKVYYLGGADKLLKIYKMPHLLTEKVGGGWIAPFVLPWIDFCQTTMAW